MSTIRVTCTAATPRTGEPITVGIPFPRGMIQDFAGSIIDASGNSVIYQAETVDRWGDGSARWVLFDWLANIGEYSINPHGAPAPAGAMVAGLNPSNLTWRLVDASNQSHPIGNAPSILTETVGPIRTTSSMRTTPLNQPGELLVRVHAFAGLQVYRVHATFTNPQPAEHPDGCWDLGSRGSLFLKSLQCVIPAAGQAMISLHPGDPFVTGSAVEFVQESSGGENWNSRNHIDRFGVIPFKVRGGHGTLDGQKLEALRPTPIVSMKNGDAFAGVTMERFWQNFPKRLTASPEGITLDLMPGVELQGGERKTHIFWIAHAPDSIASLPLEFARQPMQVVVDPKWIASTQAIGFLTAEAEDPNCDYQTLVKAAIEGADTFERKREVIDEYGWRHFGDIYGDHEAIDLSSMYPERGAIYHKGPQPLVSHYNNQYDPVQGFGIQYLRTGDTRWRAAMEELAYHVADIDIYHTTGDKPAYNHGLFWHTYHYVDADTATHRTYPNQGRIPPKGERVPGGGPANEQNYATGLMLHYFLTGERLSRDAAIGLATWVIDMDDGSITKFGWFAKGATGLASQSRTPDYHGPGRGSANSVSALVDGHRLTGEMKYLHKAEELIRRVTHPADDIPARNLLDAENRWFYTMYLQALGKYLMHKADLGQLDAHYAYARAVLLNHARWMAENEYPYLSKPALLEYPTETWAAQDMRKHEIFRFATMLASGAERDRFRERADFFFRASIDTLTPMPTRTLCRPVVLMLSHGYTHGYFTRNPDVSLPAGPSETDFGKPVIFEPIKPRAIRNAKRIIKLGMVVGVLAVGGLIAYFVT